MNVKSYIIKAFLLACVSILFFFVYIFLNTEGIPEPSLATQAKQHLHNLRSQAEAYYQTESKLTYLGVCESEPFKATIEKIQSIASYLKCNDSDSAYAIEAKTPDNKFYCVDSTGRTEEYTESQLSTGKTFCGDY